MPLSILPFVWLWNIFVSNIYLFIQSFIYLFIYLFISLVIYSIDVEIHVVALAQIMLVDFCYTVIAIND